MLRNVHFCILLSAAVTSLQQRLAIIGQFACEIFRGSNCIKNLEIMASHMQIAEGQVLWCRRDTLGVTMLSRRERTPGIGSDRVVTHELVDCRLCRFSRMAEL